MKLGINIDNKILEINIKDEDKILFLKYLSQMNQTKLINLINFIKNNF
jgi:hypothetical protein